MGMLPHKTARRGHGSALSHVVVFLTILWCGQVFLAPTFLRGSSTFVSPNGLHPEPVVTRDALAGGSVRPIWPSTNVAFTMLPGLRAWAHDMPIVVPAVGTPALFMLVGGLVAGRLEISKWGLCASQYFSAGMILAVCGNLASEIAGHGFNTILTMTIGFALGVGTMVAVKRVTESFGDDDGSGLVDNDQRDGRTGAGQLIKSFPWPLVFAVAIDSLVDGLLLGMIGVETPKAVLMVSTATSLEMGALGLSFAAALRERAQGSARTACVVGMPLALVLGGVIGSLAAVPLQNSPLAITAMLSFGISALIYLVTQELLVEANESRQEVDQRGSTALFLFAGYLLVLILDTLELTPDAA